MKPPKDFNYLLFECNSFKKPPRQLKGCILMLYIQHIFSDSEHIMKTSMFQWVIVCDTKINDIVHDMVLFLQVIIIIQRMP